jgi:hypothetical protein
MQTQTKIFKACPSCNELWKTRDEFLADPSLKLIGYQMNHNHLRVGLFLFNHSCMTTLAVQAGNFFDMYDGPIFAERMVGRSECPEYCLHQSNLHVCPVKCECAFAREVLQIIKNRHVQAEYRVAP